MRKWIMGIWGVILALFGLFGVQIKLVADVNEIGIVAALLVIGVWIFTEFKRDWEDFKNNVKQTNKWGDPAFWTTALVSVVVPLLNLFNITISEEIITTAAAILAVLVPIFMKLFRKKEEHAVEMLE